MRTTINLITLSIFSLLIFKNAIAQTMTIDSLRNAYQLAQSDSLRFIYVDKLVGAFYLRHTDSAQVYINKGKILADKLGDLRNIAVMIHNQALVYEQTASREKAIQQYLEAIKIYEKTDHPDGLWKAHSALISRYNEIGNIEKALFHYEKAKKIIKTDDYKGRAYLNNRIGMVYGHQNELETAQRYFQQNLPLFHKLKNNNGLGYTHQNIGICMEGLGQKDSALYHLQKGLTYQRLSEQTQALASNLNSLADFHRNQNQYDLALEYYTESIELLEKGNYPFFLAEGYNNLALLYNKLNEHNNAIKYAQKALQLEAKVQNLQTKKSILGILASSYAQLKDYENAYSFEKERLVINDSINNSANKKIIEELEQQYQTKEKQAQIDLQNTQLSNQRNVLIIAILIALILLGLVFFAFRTARQRQKINAQLRQLDTTKSNFFANVSHELRTPLTLILAPLENAIKKSKNSTQKEDLELAYSNSEKLLGLVNEILDLSKLESGTMTVVNKSVELKSLLRRIFYSYDSLSKLRNIQLHFDYQITQDLWVKLDINKVEKILNNLLSNALKHSKSGDTITFSTIEKEDRLIIKVKDEGAGIPEADLPRIFNRFYQSEQKAQSLQGGTGIGLALAKELSHLMAGTISVQSQLGIGSTFSLQLPIEKIKPNLETISIRASDIPIETDVAAPVFQPQLIHAKKPKILVVEDNPEMSQFLTKTLSPYYRCSVAMNGIEGLEHLEKERFDLVTSDVMMPEMDGFTFLGKVHKRELFHHTPVIMLTARSLEADKLKGFQLGVDDYITKPFNTNELLARIDNLLKNKREREDWLEKQTPKQTSEETLDFEQELLKKAEATVLENLSNPTFKVGHLATALNYSERQLVRIIKKLTGLSPINFIKEIRLQKARQLIETHQFATIAEVSFEVGFANPSYFTKTFQKRFGKKPSELK